MHKGQDGQQVESSVTASRLPPNLQPPQLWELWSWERGGSSGSQGAGQGGGWRGAWGGGQKSSSILWTGARTKPGGGGGDRKDR